MRECCVNFFPELTNSQQLLLCLYVFLSGLVLLAHVGVASEFVLPFAGTHTLILYQGPHAYRTFYISMYVDVFSTFK